MRQQLFSDPWGSSAAPIDFANADSTPELRESPEGIREAMQLARKWEQKCPLVQGLTHPENRALDDSEEGWTV